MDHARPLTALFPGARGAVLDVLTRVQRGMTIRQIADRAGVSHPQAARHIRDLELLGIVHREHVGRSHRITLTESMASDALRRLARLRHDAILEMRDAAAALDPQPSSMIVFGSFARGDDDAESDIDVLVVLEDDVAEGAIDETLAEWCGHIASRTGNPVAEIVVSQEQLRTMAPSFLQSVSSDGILISGVSLATTRMLRVVAEDAGTYGT